MNEHKVAANAIWIEIGEGAAHVDLSVLDDAAVGAAQEEKGEGEKWKCEGAA